jgi:hypothetical protein
MNYRHSLLWIYSSSQLREVQSEKPNLQPLPYKGRGVRIKASLLQGERSDTLEITKFIKFFDSSVHIISWNTQLN